MTHNITEYVWLLEYCASIFEGIYAKDFIKSSPYLGYKVS